MSRTLVLGGLGGIGSAVCAAVHTRFDALDIVDVAIAGASVVAGGAPQNAVVHHLDLTDDDARDQWIKQYLSDVGAPDGVAWCAGVYPRRDVRDYSTAELRHIVDANLVALLALLPPLVRATVEGGRHLRLVVVGSQAGAAGGRDVAYAASKAGLVAAVKSVAREYARQGVVANVVSPGPVDTPMAAVMGDDRRRFYEEAIPLGRYSRADEVAAVVGWLLADAPVAINGTVIDVDGGLVRR
jgi:NAD(P)-dependent dehydrogenase (short-subunit alcohol dehydrogenase family)